MRIADQPDSRIALRQLLEMEQFLTDRVDWTAIRYDEGVHPKHRLMRYHDFFVHRIRPREHVLDIGCGKGEMAYDIAVRAGARVTAVDLDVPHLRFARERFAHPSVEYVEADALTYVPDRPVDVVVLSNVLEHIEHRVAFLRKLKAELRPERVLIRVPAINRHWTVALRQELGLPHFSDATHFTEYTQGSLRAELEQAGLAIVELEAGWGELWVESRPSDGAAPGGSMEEAGQD